MLSERRKIFTGSGKNSSKYDSISVTVKIGKKELILHSFGPEKNIIRNKKIKHYKKTIKSNTSDIPFCSADDKKEKLT